VIISGVFYVLLYGAAALRMRLAVLVFFAAMWLSHLPYQVTMRFRVPMTDPLLIVVASQALRPRDTITPAA
jgi:hypothetical protein